MALIQCSDVSFAYDGIKVVRGLTFGVQPGEMLSIVGENGSGKSTLVKGLLGLQPPAEGTIVYGEGLQRREIGYLAQQTPAQKDFPAGVYEVVLSGRLAQCKWRPFYTAADREVADRQMQLLGIEPLRRRCYRELSGGQQQRVLLARALCAGSRLLILDEPMAGLDPLVTQELYDLLQTLRRQTALTILMVSHDIPGALRYSDTILHLQGRQLFFGPATSYAATDFGRAFLGEESAQ